MHVIGFDISAIEDQSGLRALAEQNGGLYLTPDTSIELKNDLNTMMAMDGHEMDMDGDDMSHDMAASLSAAASVAPRSRIEIEFAGPMGSGDYIGLAEAGAAPDAVMALARAGSSGTAVLIAPRAAGSYELRYYESETGEVLAVHMIEVQ